MIKKICTYAARIIIIIFLADGFFDFSYSIIKSGQIYITKYSYALDFLRNKPLVQPGSIKDTAEGWQQIRYEYQPGIGNVPEATATEKINILSDGMRSNGLHSTALTVRSGLLLGSSQALGYKISDDQTLSAMLQRGMPGTEIKNYAGPGQTLSQTRKRWQQLIDKGLKFDFVLIAGGVYDLFKECLETPPDTLPRTRLRMLYEQVVADPFKTAPCRTERGATLALESSIDSLKETLLFGRSKNIKFFIIITPTIYNNNVNIDNLIDQQQYKKTAPFMEEIYKDFSTEISKIAAPEIIDLSQALDSKEQYFLDIGSHMSGNGNRLVARAIMEHIGSQLRSAETVR